jgi:hypothetical protein
MKVDLEDKTFEVFEFEGNNTELLFATSILIATYVKRNGCNLKRLMKAIEELSSIALTQMDLVELIRMGEQNEQNCKVKD